MIITAVVSSVEYEVVKPIWKSKSKIFRNITYGDICWWWYFDAYWLFDCSGGFLIGLGTDHISKTLPCLYWLWHYDAGNYIKLSAETDLIPGLACFLGCLFYELEMGIGLGVVIQVWRLLQSIGIVVSDTKVPRYWMLVISIHLNSVAIGGCFCWVTTVSVIKVCML